METPEEHPRPEISGQHTHTVRIVGKTEDELADLIAGLTRYWQANPPTPEVMARAMTAACLLSDAMNRPDGAHRKVWHTIAVGLADYVASEVDWWWPNMEDELAELANQAEPPPTVL